MKIYVDLDGTLLTTDTLHEQYFALLKNKPFRAIGVLSQLSKGKAKFKSVLAKESLPYLPVRFPKNDEVARRIDEHRKRGQEIVLATGAHRDVVNHLLPELGEFTHVLSTDENTNLVGVKKLKAILEHSQDKPFTYFGDSQKDLPIFERAHKAIVVDRSNLASRAQAKEVERIPMRSRIRLIIKSLRLHQWAKNLLLVLPPLAAHLPLTGELIQSSLLAFLAYGFTASSAYLINDLVDIESDRKHDRKKNRPFASGALSPLFGLAAAPFLLTAAGVLCTQLPLSFSFVLLLYFALTLAYSFWLKKIVMLDVLTLSGLYCIRIFAGGAATQTPISEWLIAFALFFFLSLAIVKRYSELLKLVEKDESKAHGRGYHTTDMAVLAALGASSGVMATLVLALYINSTKVVQLYHTPQLLWFCSPILLYWISRVWILTVRGEMDDDPVLFALKDRLSYVCVLAMGLILVLAARSYA